LITVRHPGLPTDGVSRYWYRGSALLTHFYNAAFLLFPEGERYFVRHAKRALSHVRRPELQQDVRSFIAQEAQHAREHQRFFTVYDAQSLPYRVAVDAVAALIRAGDHISTRLLGEIASAHVSLAITAAFEHYAASWAEHMFRDPDQLDGLDPRMRTLLFWHYAEELEHKHVAFEMLRDLNDRYILRAAGMCVASAALWIMMSALMVHLMRADRELHVRRLGKELVQALRAPDNPIPLGIKSFFRYLRPRFHPHDIVVPDACRVWLARFDAAPGCS